MLGNLKEGKTMFSLSTQDQFIGRLKSWNCKKFSEIALETITKVHVETRFYNDLYVEHYIIFDSMVIVNCKEHFF